MEINCVLVSTGARSCLSPTSFHRPSPSSSPPSGFAPSLEDVLRDLRHARASLDVCHDERPSLTLRLSVPRHHLQAGAHRLRQFHFVDYQ